MFHTGQSEYLANLLRLSVTTWNHVPPNVSGGSQLLSSQTDAECLPPTPDKVVLPADEGRDIRFHRIPLFLTC